MKKIFTLALALMGCATFANAASVDDIAVTKHSFVVVCDELGARPGKGVLFGSDHILDVNGGSTATNKGQVDLSVVDALGEDGAPLYVTQAIVDKYGADYAGPHYNWLRLKNAQDVIAMRLTAKSKIIMFIQGNNKTGKDARIPKIATDAKLENALNPAPDENHASTVSGFRWEYTVADDGLYYIGSYNGDMFVSFIIVEANEAPGTPTVKVSDMQFDGSVYYKEVSCKANKATEEGSEEQLETIVTYTTDGSTPTAESEVYKNPIKCTKNMTIKFQAYLDLGGTPEEDFKCDGADNEANVAFSFDAPAITNEGGAVSIASTYNNATNYYKIGNGEEVAGNSLTLTQAATIMAYTKIANGDVTFESKKSTIDVYEGLLSPIKEKKTIKVNGGEAVLDEDATATSTTGPVYKVENGTISADPKDFFVKNLEFSVLKDANAQYQIDDQEIYIKMNATNIIFQVAEGDSVDVKVICSKNACKNIESETENDRKCYVNVSNTNYCHKDAEGNEAADMANVADANIIEFGLAGGKTYTFQKYSGTGNILISSIEITPVATDGIATINAANKNADGAIFNLAGQKVDANYKGVVIAGGKKMLNQ